MKTVMENGLLMNSQYLADRNFQIGLRFSYSFGNQKVKQVQKRNTSNSAVRERVNVE